MVAVIILQILVRRALNRPFMWAEDLNVFLFVWLTFLGAAVLFSRRQLITVDVIATQTSPRVMRLLDSVVDLIMSVASLYLTRLSLGFLNRQMVLGHKLGGALGIPSWTLTMSLVIGVVMMMLSSVGFLLRGLWGIDDNKSGGATE